MSHLTLEPHLLPPTSVDYERSRALGRKVRARNGYCYKNSINALPLVVGARYAEGFVVRNDRPLWIMEHGWLSLPDGTVIDPTPCYLDGRSRTYIPAFHWTADDVYDIAVKQRSFVTPLCWMRPAHGQESVTWRDAKLAAVRHLAALYEASGVVYCPPGEEENFLVANLGAFWVPREGERDAVRRRRAAILAESDDSPERVA